MSEMGKKEKKKRKGELGARPNNNSMEEQKIYTKADMQALSTVEVIAFLSDHSSAEFDVQYMAKELLQARMSNMAVSTEAIEAEMATARASSSKAYKILLQEEVHRRKASQAQREGVEKDEQRVAKITGRKRKYTGPAETLLRADNNESIFKIKVQWKNTKFIDTIYSRDFPSERTWFQGDQLTMLEQKLGQSQSPGEFFQKGGLRNAGFNGFTYNLSRFERDASQLCWFAIYLNLVLEQQPNGEFWGMEIFSWGKRVVR